MTFREKLKREHPERINEYYSGGAALCPCSYGYEEAQACTVPGMKKMTCRECWAREMEREEVREGA